MRIPPVLFLFSLLFYCMCLRSHVFVVPAFCLEDQQSLLFQFKNNLTFNSTTSIKLVSWNQSFPCCDWSGVTCDEEGHVTGLDLSYELISGGFDNSSSLFSLQYLQNLNLANNNFNSSIPSTIANLKNLTSLDLSYAGFVGQIPIEISQLNRLDTLDLSSDNSVTIINLQKLVQNLTSIRQLYLDGVIISVHGHKWSNALLSLPSLVELSMFECNLSSPIDSSLTRLENLSIINLGGNNLPSLMLESFANFKNLTTLKLDDCGLKGIFSQKIFQVQTLSVIDISNNDDLHCSLSDFPLNGFLQTLIARNTSFSGVLSNISNLRHLSQLDLSLCQLSGTFPSSLLNLTQLTHLSLSFNNFIGSIPSFDMLKKLTYVDLSHNSFNERIPSSLFALPLLQRIDLSFNHFDGQIVEFSTMSFSTLEFLDLSNNYLEGLIPLSLFKLKKLSYFRLSSNKFNGTVKLDLILNLQELTFLDISHNFLSIDANVMDDNISSLPKLEVLHLASCKLREFPAFLRNQSSLTKLDLSNNLIQGMIPNWIWKFDFLSNINLSSNFLTSFEGSLLNHTTNSYALDFSSNQLQGKIPVFPLFTYYLDCSSNNFSSAIPSKIGTQLPLLSFLSFSENNFHGSIPHSLCNASNLLVLDLTYNHFEGTIPECLIKSETLEVVSLGNNMLNGNILDTFPVSCALKTINLHGNRLGGLIPKSLANCMDLEVLDLGNNQINGRFPCFLKKISTLRVIVLRTNKFQGPIGCFNTNGTWSELQIFDLAFNNFSGLLPAKAFTNWEVMMHVEDPVGLESKQIGLVLYHNIAAYYRDSVTVMSKGQEMKLVKILPVFTSIDFSSNNFEGPIPRELMNLKGLHILNLSNNAFSGQIPSSIGNMKMLESLDLSGNSLIGEIPTQLASLTFLEVLNLSSNHLVGRIPTGTQIQSFEASSFQGNDGLYGPPLTKDADDGKPGLLPPPASGNHHAVDFNFITGAEVGVIFGFGIIIVPLFFWRQWRIRYWNCVDTFLCSIFPQLYLEHQRREGQMYRVLRWRH